MVNLFRQLTALMPGEALQVGTVQAVNVDGTSDVALVGGGVARFSGDGFPVGQSVFVRGSQIVSASPAPSFVLVEV
ncbi:MAG: hypothetical protein AAGI11_15335 [Pseudomonadota bacterium]